MENPLLTPEYAKSARQGRGRAIGAGFMYFGIYFGMQIIVIAVYAIVQTVILFRNGSFSLPSLTEDISQSAIQNALPLTGVSNLLTLIVYRIIFAARRCQVSEETGLKRAGFPAILLMIPLGVCCYVFVACVLSLLFSLLPGEIVKQYAEQAETLVGATTPLAIICVVLIAPFTEEVVFRGLVYTRWQHGMGRILALFAASLLFGIMHVQVIWAAYAFSLSLLLCAVFDWYGSLWAGVILHLSFNLCQYALAPFLESVPFLPLLLGSVLLGAPLALFARRMGPRTRSCPLP